MSLRIHFRHCSPRHADNGSLLRRLVEEASGTSTTVVGSAKEADLVLSSDRYSRSERAWRSGMYASRSLGGRLFAGRTDPRSAAIGDSPPDGVPSIWFTQENARPPGGPWAGYLSFDQDPLDGRNAYFPSWWWLVDVLGAPGVDHFLGRSLTVEELLSSRQSRRDDRPGFACAFINNPTPMRLHAVSALRKVGPVDVFGRAVGRPVGSKLDMARQYRFVICFENDLYPGYVTEKAPEAWGTGAIPLWWGQDPAGYLNGQALVNAAETPSFADMAEVVAGIDSSDETWLAMAGRPLLARPPDLSAALSVVRQALEGAI